MATLIAGFVILSLAYTIGVTLALFKEHGYRLVEVFYGVVEAIQDIKSYKAKRTSRGS